MITFKAIVIPNNRRRDGTYPVKIRVYFRGQSRRMATTLACTAGDLTRSLRIKSPTILGRADALIVQMREAVQDLSPFTLEAWTVDDVVQHIRTRLGTDAFRLDFFEWADTFLKSKTPTTRKAYEVSLNTLERFLGERRLDVNDITRAMLQDFAAAVEAAPKVCYDPATGGSRPSTIMKKSRRSTSMHIFRLAHIFNAAKAKYNDEDEGKIPIPRSPFAKIEKPLPLCTGQRALERETMQAIISAEVHDPAVRFALDVFVISFALMGANMADLYAAQQVRGGVWKYNRQKTARRRADNAEMRVTVPAQLAPFLERMTDGRSRWWLPALREHGTTKDQCTTYVNRHLAKWAKSADLEPFTLYAARHTWATLARRAGVEKATIDECLCHVGDYEMADIYAERSWDLLQAANRRVLEQFSW